MKVGFVCLGFVFLLQLGSLQASLPVQRHLSPNRTGPNCATQNSVIQKSSTSFKRKSFSSPDCDIHTQLSDAVRTRLLCCASTQWSAVLSCAKYIIRHYITFATRKVQHRDERWTKSCHFERGKYKHTHSLAALFKKD